MDWIGFNIQGLLNRKQVEIIAKYLFENFRFNSTFAFGSDGKQETLFSNLKNKYQVYFRAYKYSDIYWDGIKIDFSGLNAARFYFFLKEQIIDWTIFSSAVLNRFDLYFERNYKTAEKISGREFSQNCQKNIKQTNKNTSLEKNRKGWILKIGKRGSPNYYRVYESDIEIRFELEQRGLKIKSAQKLIFKYQIENFEEIMTKTFFNYSKKVLAIHENYTDWLIDYFRRQNQTEGSLVRGYFNTVSFDQKKVFFRFLQFIAFSRTQTATTEKFCEQSYYIIQFKLTDFMDFIQKNNKNQYQRKQLIQFFEKI